MARYIKVGAMTFNQEAIATVGHDAISGVTRIELQSGMVHRLSGYEAAAFGNWLARHIKGFGADALEDYASDLADEARRMHEQQLLEEGL